MDKAVFERIREAQHAALFRVDRGSGHPRVVDSPHLGNSLASAFERVARFADPILEIGRMGLHEVHFACFGFDAVEDGVDLLADIPAWTRNGAITVRHMAGGRC